MRLGDVGDDAGNVGALLAINVGRLSFVRWLARFEFRCV